MVVLSEYIQIAAGIYAIALFYSIVTFRRSKRIDQIGTLNGIMSDLRASPVGINLNSQKQLRLLLFILDNMK